MSHEQFQNCIDACYQCALVCDHCAASCLAEGNAGQMARCIALDIDCAEICRLAAGYMGRGSEMTKAICEACAKVCDACGEECAKHQNDHCLKCAQMCRQCAQECRAMA
jgi:hypothetical protein